MISGPPPDAVAAAMGEYVDPFVTAITFIDPKDDREPPGEHWGTGWLFEKSGVPYIATCEHVAKRQVAGYLGYSCHGCSDGISVGSKFELVPYPIDVAKASIERTFRRINHDGKCTNRAHFANRHSPVEGEYFYAYGFPGVNARVAFGQHEIQGMGVFLREVDFNPEAFSEQPAPIRGTHICLAWNPESATGLLGTTGALSLPNGMSGSPLWNTRYVEMAQQGLKWSPSDSRIAGIVWGHSAKSCHLFATPIETFINFLFPEQENA